MPRQVNKTNYQNITLALGKLLTLYTGAPVEYGDFSKFTQASPSFVIQHARLKSPPQDRHPNYEDYNWTFPVHMFFDYQSDAEAHALIDQYRVTITQALAEYPLLDLGGIGPYPPGQSGHAKDSKLVAATLTGYFELDHKPYALSTYEVWVQERVLANNAGTPSH